MIAKQDLPAGVQHPTEARLGQFPAQQADRRNGAQDVAHRPEPQDEDFQSGTVPIEGVCELARQFDHRRWSLSRKPERL